MRDNVEMTAKNGKTLLDRGPCQFCAAATTFRGDEWVQIFGAALDVIEHLSSQTHCYNNNLRTVRAIAE